MKLLVATDAHIYRTPDGKCWCKSIYGYDFWTRYLHVFDEVRIVARVKDVYEVGCGYKIVTGDNVEVFGIPFFRGPKQLLMKLYSIIKSLKGVDDGCGAALLRMPSPTASIVRRYLRKDIPIAGEIVYDFSDDIDNGCKNFLLRILSKIQAEELSVFCRSANGVSYVTEKTIQSHYPSYARLYGEDSNHFEASYSTITLSESAFTGPRDFSNIKSVTLALSSVAMNSERKGEKILIKTVKICRDRGYNVKAVLIGDGALRSSFEEYAKALEVDQYIEFTGLLPSSNEVRKVMERADIFVFPTQGEGLPRGILEAMAIGMPVLSTPVGGISELIEYKYLFDYNNAEMFANEVERLLHHQRELTEMSKRNYIKSLKFNNKILQERRNLFYRKLRKLCE